MVPWFSLCYGCWGEKKEVKAQHKKSRDATWQRLVDVWWLLSVVAVKYEYFLKKYFIGGFAKASMITLKRALLWFNSTTSPLIMLLAISFNNFPFIY